LRELARRANTSHATLLAYEQGKKAPSVVTFLRILHACGFAVDFRRSRRIRRCDGLERGKELEAALDLAAQFPARHSKNLIFPRFPHR
jgi:transcriptional regulator with XRE-family HTH domain